MAAAALVVRHRYVAITVEGMSMSPALYDGEKVLIRRGIGGLRKGRIVSWPGRIRFRDGVTIRGWSGSGFGGWYIKRVVAVAGEPYPPELNRSGVVPSGHVVVVGDHRRSEDSKQHGACPIDQILGVQVRKLSVSGPAGSVLPSSQTWSDEELKALTVDPGELDALTEYSATSPEGAEADEKPDEPDEFVGEVAEKPGASEEAADTEDAGKDEPVKKAAKKTAKKAAKKTAKKAVKKAAKKAAKKSAKKTSDSGNGDATEK